MGEAKNFRGSHHEKSNHVQYEGEENNQSSLHYFSQHSDERRGSSVEQTWDSKDKSIFRRRNVVFVLEVVSECGLEEEQADHGNSAGEQAEEGARVFQEHAEGDLLLLLAFAVLVPDAVLLLLGRVAGPPFNGVHTERDDGGARGDARGFAVVAVQVVGQSDEGEEPSREDQPPEDVECDLEGAASQRHEDRAQHGTQHQAQSEGQLHVADVLLSVFGELDGGHGVDGSANEGVRKALEAPYDHGHAEEERPGVAVSVGQVGLIVVLWGPAVRNVVQSSEASRRDCLMLKALP